MKLSCILLIWFTTLINLSEESCFMSGYQWAKSDKMHPDYHEVKSKYLDSPITRTGRYIQCENETISEDIVSKITPYRRMNYVLGLHINNSKSLIIPSKAFDLLPKFEDMMISYTNIQSIEVGAFNGLVELPMLTITRSNLTIIGDLYFTPLIKLMDLDLSYNSINIIEDKAFHTLSRLSRIDLSHNKLRQLTKHIFEDLKHLKFIDLSYNQINQLNEGIFETVETLMILLLNHNELKEIPDHLISKNSKLRQLYVENNHLTQMRDIQLNSSNIELSLKNNNIQNIRLTKFVHLELLDLSNNDLLQLNNRDFLRLSVNILILDENSIRPSVNMNIAFVNLTTTIEISLKNNKLFLLSLDMFQNNTALQTLFLDGNKLRQLPLLPLGISSLSLRNNSFNSSLSISHLKEIDLLDLSINNLSHIKYEFLKDIISLRLLYLQMNQISFIETGSFRDLYRLKELNLSYNYIQFLEVGSFNGINNLVKLDLSHNRLTEISDETFHNINFLEILDLSFNNISEMNLENTALHLKKLKNVGLEGNHWSCSALAKFLTDVEHLRVIRGSYYDVENIRGIACQKKINEVSKEKQIVEDFLAEFVSNQNTSNTLLIFILIVVFSRAVVNLLKIILEKISRLGEVSIQTPSSGRETLMEEGSARSSTTQFS